jgi:hypothetical protein
MRKLVGWSVFWFLAGAVLTLEAVLELQPPARVHSEVQLVQCCPMLDVPLSEQVELDYQYGLTPTPAPPTTPDAWREVLQGAPCR